MAKYLKPQTPLQHQSGDYIYPITTVDQIITANGERLNSKIVVVDTENVNIGEPNPVNADTLGGSSLDDIKGYVNDQITNRVICGKGKNLLKNTTKSQTINGVTFTVNDDGSITANGTATAIAEFRIATNFVCEYDAILSGCTGGSSTTYRLQYYSGDGSFAVNNYDGDNQISGGKTGNIRIYIVAGVTVNTTFYPMIRIASETDDTYEPYYEGLKELTDRGMELLWENASPTSEFAKDALVTFPAGYDLYMIRATGLYGRNIPSVFFRFGEDLWVNASFGDVSQSAHRTFFAHSRGLLAGNGFTKNTVNDTCCIPLEVYGIKGVSV